MNNISTRIGRVVKPTYKILAKNVIPQKPQKQAKPQKPQKQAKPQKTRTFGHVLDMTAAAQH